MKKNMTPIIGLVVGLGLIVWSISMDGTIGNFINTPSLIITLFGSFCALMISFPLKVLKNIPGTLKLLLLTSHDNRETLVGTFSTLSRKARKDGLLSLEDDIALLKDEFMVSGLQMVVDGMEPDAIRGLLELKLDTIERRHRLGQEVILKWAELAPAFGMLGTLIGLIVMLAGLDDPSSIGSGMATALITTFYGSLLANLIFIPIASNLSSQTDEEMFRGQMMIDGILEIQAGSNPRALEEKLMAYLSPSEQKSIKAEANTFKEAQRYEQ